MPDFKNRTCCITGHRNIPFGDEQKILTKVDQIVDSLLDKGVEFFGVGGAVGFDMLDGGISYQSQR